LFLFFSIYLVSSLPYFLDFFKKVAYNKRRRFLYGDVLGFDSNLETPIASSGFSLATKKNGKLNLNADNRELAYAA